MMHNCAWRPPRFAAAWLLFVLCAVAMPLRAAWAQQLAVPVLTGPLMDTAALMRSPEARLLQAELTAVRQDSGVQLVVFTLPTLLGEDPAPFANRVMEAWRLGAKGSDLGLLLLIAQGDRTTRLEVGYGLEGVLPDALAKQILADVLAPKRPGEALSGRHVLGTVQLLHRLLQEARVKGLLPDVTPDVPPAAAAAQVPLWALALGVVLVLVLARYLLSFMPKEAPSDGFSDASDALGAYGALPGRRRGASMGRASGAFWHTLVQLLLAILGGGGRGGPPSGGGGYSGGGGRSGGGGASDKY